ncbi:MAG: NYN domain-containing protein [Candidatus Methylumidiphilus sp.]
MSFEKSKLTRIGVFYDGNYFFHVSNYYQYQHARKARISIDGLHEFIRHQAAEVEGEDVKYCQIVDAHYFRGRPRAQEAEARGLLLRERQFDDILMREGVITHYLPLGPDGEKGIDVWLALETYELAIYKRFDVIVLIACDGDFLPLVRKLNALGTRVMLLGWGFSYIDQSGKDRETRTAQVLLEEVTYPVLMHQIIDDRSRKGDPRIDQLFVPHKDSSAFPKPGEPVKKIPAPTAHVPHAPTVPNGPTLTGKIQALREGFGFITPSDGSSNLFFFHASVLNADFNELRVSDDVHYRIGNNDKGVCAVDVELILP